MNVQSRQMSKLPDIYLSGETVEQIIAHLNNSVLFAKSPDGSMRPFVDPIPITQIIANAIQATMRQPQSEVSNETQ